MGQALTEPQVLPQSPGRQWHGCALHRENSAPTHWSLRAHGDTWGLWVVGKSPASELQPTPVRKRSPLPAPGWSESLPGKPLLLSRMANTALPMPMAGAMQWLHHHTAPWRLDHCQRLLDKHWQACLCSFFAKKDATLKLTKALLVLGFVLLANGATFLIVGLSNQLTAYWTLGPTFWALGIVLMATAAFRKHQAYKG